MSNNLPIIRRSRQATWALIDAIEIYSHGNVRCSDGTGTVAAINKKTNTVDVNVKGRIKTYPARNVKIFLRPLTQLQGKNLSVIANLAMGIDGFTYSVKRTGRTIQCIGKAYTVEIYIKPEFAIRVFDANGTAKEARNLGYIMTYLTMRSFDLLNLLRTPYALISSGTPQQ